MLQKIKNKLSRDIHLKDLVRGSAITFILKMCGMGLGYVLIFLISKRLGAEGVGFYSLIVQILNVLGMVLGLGMNTSVLRYVGQFNNVGDQPKMRSLNRHFITVVGPLSVVVSLILYFTAGWIMELMNKGPEYVEGLKMVAVVLPFFTINQISVEFIRGLQKLHVSELVRSVLRPMIIIIGILAIFWKDLTKMDVIYFLVVALIVNSMVSRWTIWKKLKTTSKVSSSFELKELLKTSVPMMVTGLSSKLLVAMPIFFLDYFTTQADVGIYSVAFRLAGLVSLVLVVVNTIAAPKFSELYWADGKEELQKVISQSAKIMFWAGLTISVVLIFGAEWWLGLFGEEFKQGKWVLIILVFGQFVNAITGPAGSLLNMSGNQLVVSCVMIFVTIFLPAGYIYAVPKYALEGCALISILGGAVTLNSLMVFIAYKKLNMLTVYIPKLFLK